MKTTVDSFTCQRWCQLPLHPTPTLWDLYLDAKIYYLAGDDLAMRPGSRRYRICHLNVAASHSKMLEFIVFPGGLESQNGGIHRVLRG